MAKKVWYVGWVREFKHDDGGDIASYSDVECGAFGSRLRAFDHAAGRGQLDRFAGLCDDYMTLVEEVAV